LEKGRTQPGSWIPPHRRTAQLYYANMTLFLYPLFPKIHPEFQSNNIPSVSLYPSHSIIEVLIVSANLTISNISEKEKEMSQAVAVDRCASNGEKGGIKGI
jgi:hypothetical protein